MRTLLLQERKTSAQMRLPSLAPSRKNLGPNLLLSWRSRMMTGKRPKIGRETERFHRNLRLQEMRMRKIQRRRRKKTLIQRRRKIEDRCIPRLQKGLRSRQVCSKTVVGRHCRLTRLIVESQKKLLANWRKMRSSQMKRRIHQRRNLRERRMEEKPGLEKWKRYSDLHYMMV